MARIFLCYRSGDDAYAAALLDEKLSNVFGVDDIFRASRSIRPGESYTSVIMQALKQCETMLVIIGPRWVDSIGTVEGLPAPADQDWVRIEISTALENQANVIPLLLSRTSRLDPRRLPSDIADLAYRQYLTFDHRNVDRDFNQIFAALGNYQLQPEAVKPPG